jgi:hypothetical protein
MDRWLQAYAGAGKSAQELLEESLSDTLRVELEKNASHLLEKKATSNLDHFKAQTKLAYDMGRELAIKQAGIAGMATSALGAMKPMATKALGWAAKNPAAAAGVGGAAIGALNAPPGGRIQGAAAGGAIGAGAAHLGKAGVTNLATKGMAGLAKFAGLSPNMMRAGVGAAIGGVAGAIHKSPGEQQGMAPGHHLRNALIGAGVGGALGGASSKAQAAMAGMGKSAPGAAIHSAPTLLKNAPKAPGAASIVSNAAHNPYAMQAAAHTPDELRQMERVRSMANSPEAAAARLARGAAAMGIQMKAEMAEHLGKGLRSSAPSAAVAATPTAAGYVKKLASRGGREFLKLAMSMSAQAEPGNPSGAQEPEAESQAQSAPQRPASLPAQQLYNSLKHLSPKFMSSLQVAPQGS